MGSMPGFANKQTAELELTKTNLHRDLSCYRRAVVQLADVAGTIVWLGCLQQVVPARVAWMRLWKALPASCGVHSIA